MGIPDYFQQYLAALFSFRSIWVGVEKSDVLEEAADEEGDCLILKIERWILSISYKKNIQYSTLKFQFSIKKSFR